MTTTPQTTADVAVAVCPVVYPFGSPSAGVCPTCGRTVDAHIGAQREALEATARELLAADLAPAGLAPSVRVERRPAARDWLITTDAELTDEEALALTFRADPKDVRLGDFVELVDAGGTRIGHVATATYRERIGGPAYVVVTIALR